MHSGTGEIAYNAFVIFMKSKDDNHASCLVFSKEATCTSADDHNRNFFFVSLHMDSGAVSGVALYIDFSAAHGITGSVTDIAMNQNLSFIHGIAHSVLRIRIYRNIGIV